MNHHRKVDTWQGAITRVLLLTSIILTAIASFAQESNYLRFEGGIGVQTVTGVAANGAVNLNVVRGVSPAGPWKIGALRAEIDSNGHIRVVGRGLLLAAGNGIGTNGGQSVHATLFCGPATGATAFSTNTAGVPLAADGDFVIDEFLSSAPALPCDSPVLLIRNVAGAWFAAGIPEAKRIGRD